MKINQHVKITAAWMTAISVASIAGALFVAYGYAYAAAGDQGLTHFHLFWFGVLLFFVPVCARICGRQASRAEYLTMLALVALFNYLVKLLRSPEHLLFFDELGHWRQAEMILRTGRLFLPNPQVYIGQFFPGLHAMTVEICNLTGLSTFTVGQILIAGTHIAALYGIFAIVDRLTRSSRIAALSAVIYSLNPGFMYYDTQYAYESVGIVLLIWTIAAVVASQDAHESRAAQRAWLVIAVVLAVGCVITHHASSYVLLTVLWLMAAERWLRARRVVQRADSSDKTLPIAVLATVVATAWLVFVVPRVTEYLSRPVIAAGRQLVQAVTLHPSAGHEPTKSTTSTPVQVSPGPTVARQPQVGADSHSPTLPAVSSQGPRQNVRHWPFRSLFANAGIPGYERTAAFASVFIAALGTILGFWRLSRNRRLAPGYNALSFFGLLYFASMPLLLTDFGNETARRSWSFTYIGLAVLVAPPAALFCRGGRSRARAVQIVAVACVIGLLSVVLVGNVASAMNELYRFPGPYVYGSDTRSTTDEMLEAARWFRMTQGIGQRVVADRYMRQVFLSFGLAWSPLPSEGFPVWELYFKPGPPKPELLDELRYSDFRYLVVDTQMSRYLPRIGWYFSSDEPGAHPPNSVVANLQPPSGGLLQRFETLPWAIKVYQSNNISIYRLNYSALNLRWKP